jgi:hypothetical protein
MAEASSADPTEGPADPVATEAVDMQNVSNGPITSKTGHKRPVYTYDENKITLRFIFANKDGLAVTMDCTPSQTIGEVKASLLSAWPEGAYVLF